MRSGALGILALVAVVGIACHDANAPIDMRDRRPIVFMTLGPTGDWQLARADVKSAQASIAAPGDRQAPAVDRSGTKLAFVASTGIYVANADGSNAVLVPGVEGQRVAWSPDGTQLAIGRRFYDLSPQVEIVTLATQRVERLVLPSGLQPNAATWSPDGRRLLVEIPGTAAGAGIVSTALDGSDPHVIVPPTTAPFGWVRDASYSPDGRQIVYARFDSSGSTIRVLNADGSHDRRLTEPGSVGVDPVWSPSGQFIAYSWSDGQRYDIVVMPLDGGTGWTVSSNLAWGGTDPGW